MFEVKKADTDAISIKSRWYQTAVLVSRVICCFARISPRLFLNELVVYLLSDVINSYISEIVAHATNVRWQMKFHCIQY